MDTHFSLIMESPLPLRLCVRFYFEIHKGASQQFLPNGAIRYVLVMRESQIEPSGLTGPRVGADRFLRGREAEY